LLEKARTKEKCGKTRTGVRVRDGTAQRQKHGNDSHKKRADKDKQASALKASGNTGTLTCRSAKTLTLYLGRSKATPLLVIDDLEQHHGPHQR
jgi:hypothetical protein